MNDFPDWYVRNFLYHLQRKGLLKGMGRKRLAALEQELIEFALKIQHLTCMEMKEYAADAAVNLVREQRNLWLEQMMKASLS